MHPTSVHLLDKPLCCTYCFVYAHALDVNAQSNVCAVLYSRGYVSIMRNFRVDPYSLDTEAPDGRGQAGRLLTKNRFPLVCNLKK